MAPSVDDGGDFGRTSTAPRRYYMYCPSKAPLRGTLTDAAQGGDSGGGPAVSVVRGPRKHMAHRENGITKDSQYSHRHDNEACTPPNSQQEKMAALRLTYSRKMVMGQVHHSQECWSPMGERKRSDELRRSIGSSRGSRLRWSDSQLSELRQGQHRIGSGAFAESPLSSFRLPSAYDGRQHSDNRGSLAARGQACVPSRRPSTSNYAIRSSTLTPPGTVTRGGRAEAPGTPRAGSERVRRQVGRESTITATTSAVAMGKPFRNSVPSVANAYVSFLSAGGSNRQPGSVASSVLQGIGNREFEAWKKKHKVKEGTKVFHISIGEKVGVYEPMRAGLLKRGWVENSDPGSTSFDFRWVNTGVNYEVLRPQQLVNHYEEQQHVTTKAGLCETLRDCRWATDADSDQFYPRCYNLWDPTDRSHFIDDFRETAAVAVLRRAASGQALPDRLFNLSLSVCRAKVATERYLVSDDDPVADAMPPPIVTRADWDSLVSYISAYPEQPISVDPDDPPAAQPAVSVVVASTNKLNQNGHNNNDTESPSSAALENNGEEPPTISEMDSTNGGFPILTNGVVDIKQAGVDMAVESGSDHYSAARRSAASAKATAAAAVLRAMSELSAQSSLNRQSNVWIVKPGGKSRGRGIALFNSLTKLLKYTETMTGAEKWVAQKYIEKPLIIDRRKFDIRQWVLVTSWNPLTVWFYGECYLRFTADEYDINDLDIFAHLSNNSISKYREVVRDDEITKGGNMWTAERFQAHLDSLPGVGAATWQESIVPQMKAIARHSLQTAKVRMTPRRNSFALFGYDYMIDEEMQVWLLEINKSPTMEPSTPITERLCREVQEDILKVVIDCPAASLKPSVEPTEITEEATKANVDSSAEERNDETPGETNDSNRTEGRTGKWCCIVCDVGTVAKPLYFPGHDRLMCRGEGLKPASI